MNERATDQMGCAHPWPVLVDLRVCVCVYEREVERVRLKEPHSLYIKNLFL